jgi:hypothetical protein
VASEQVVVGRKVEDTLLHVDHIYRVSKECIYIISNSTESKRRNLQSNQKAPRMLPERK